MARPSLGRTKSRPWDWTMPWRSAYQIVTFHMFLSLLGFLGRTIFLHPQEVKSFSHDELPLSPLPFFLTHLLVTSLFPFSVPCVPNREALTDAFHLHLLA